MSKVFHCRPDSISFVHRWKVLGALHSPNGIFMYSNSPYFVMNAVFALSFSLMAICQHPLCKSSVENILAPARQSKHVSIRGSGYANLDGYIVKFLVINTPTHCTIFLRTRTTGDAHSEYKYFTTPAFNWSCKYFSSCSPYCLTNRSCSCGVDTVPYRGIIPQICFMFGKRFLVYFNQFSK